MPVRGKGFNQPVGISGSNQFGHSTTHHRTPLDAERRQPGGEVGIIEARDAAQQRLAAVGHEVLVCTSQSTLKAKPLPAELRALLEPYTLSKDEARANLGAF